MSSSPLAVVVSSPLPAPVEKNSDTIASDGGDGGNAGGSKIAPVAAAAVDGSPSSSQVLFYYFP